MLQKLLVMQHVFATRIQSSFRMSIMRYQYNTAYRVVIKLQAHLRTLKFRRKFRVKRKAADLLKRALQSFTRSADLARWIEDVHTLAQIGDDGFVEDLLDFHPEVEEYSLIRDIKEQAANIRHAPSFSSLIHSAVKAENATPNVLEVVMEMGGELDCITKKKNYWVTRDTNGDTPLHVVARLGDQFMSVTETLIKYSANKKTFINTANLVSATALDIAIDEQLSNINSNSHRNFINYLFDNGGRSPMFGSRKDVEKLLQDAVSGLKMAAMLKKRREEIATQRAMEALQDNAAYKLAKIRGELEEKKKLEAQKKKEAARLRRDRLEREREIEEKQLAAELAQQRKEQAKEQRANERTAKREERRLARERVEKAMETSGPEEAAAVGKDSSTSDSPSVPPAPDVQKSQNGSLSQLAAERRGKVIRLILCLEQNLAGNDMQGWYYKDEHGKIQGSFDGQTMAEWYSAGYLGTDLLLATSEAGPFYRLQDALVGAKNAEDVFDSHFSASDLQSLRTDLQALLSN